MPKNIFNKRSAFTKSMSGDSTTQDSSLLRKEEKDKWLDVATFKAWLERYESHF